MPGTGRRRLLLRTRPDSSPSRVVGVWTFPSYDGTVLACHERGTGTPPLVCLPGGPGRASAYLGDLGGLSATTGLLLLDTRGTGDSAIPVDESSYRCDRLVEDVEALRIHCGLGQLDLLGHSAGASIATMYAAAYPERIRRLVLAAPSARATAIDFSTEEFLEGVRRRSHEPWFAESYAALERLLAGEASPADQLAAGRFSHGRWTAEAIAMEEAEPAQLAPAARAGFNTPGAYGDPFAMRAALAKLAAPVLLIGGDLDPAPNARLLTEYAALFQHSSLVFVPGGCHFPWLDDPKLWCDTVSGFLH